MTDVYDNYLIHWGKKGMKWGVRHDRITLGDRVRMHTLKKQAAALNRRTGPRWKYDLQTHKMLSTKGYDTYTNKKNRTANEKIFKEIEANTHSKDRTIRRDAKRSVPAMKVYKKSYQIYDKTLAKYQKTLRKYNTKDTDLDYAAKLIASVTAQSKSTIVGEVSMKDYNHLVDTRNKYRNMQSKHSIPKGW